VTEYTLRGRNETISTDFNGIISLLNFYNYAKQYQNITINLNLDGINFIDANLCAFLYAIIYKLRTSNRIRTYIDFHSLKKDLNVLIRNGFTNYIAGNQSAFKPYDNRDTTIPLFHFSQSDADAYCNYIESDFLHQRGLRKLRLIERDMIVSSYLEIFDNVGLHANTREPIFVCGQYFPYQCELKFTMVDLGEGFLRKIAEFTKDTIKITKGSDAVCWAVRGNSTKKDAKGGTGLRDIFMFCNRSGGSLQIITDDCFYSMTEKKETTFKIPHPFHGTTINLIFKYLYN
jgi:hypothetical protein